MKIALKIEMKFYKLYNKTPVHFNWNNKHYYCTAYNLKGTDLEFTNLKKTHTYIERSCMIERRVFHQWTSCSQHPNNNNTTRSRATRKRRIVLKRSIPCKHYVSIQWCQFKGKKHWFVVPHPSTYTYIHSNIRKLLRYYEHNNNCCRWMNVCS